MKCLSTHAASLALILISLLVLIAGNQLRAQAATEASFYARKNTFGVLSAYSNDSSHILIGAAERRKLLEVGVGYDRRLLLNHILNWQYSAELLPVALESDPLTGWVTNLSAPSPATFSGVLPIAPVLCSPDTVTFALVSNGVTFSGSTTYFCRDRQWTMGGAISPIGFRSNFLPAHRLQPFVAAHGGYMYSTRQIPTGGTDHFNFTFDIGGGFEFYRDTARSIRLEYLVHHISNAGLGKQNPGIDSGTLQLTYAFGLGRQ